jgi:hypothetical protein
MKRFTLTILALVLTMVVSSTAFAGHIAVGRASGHIPVGTAGHIAVGRSATTRPSANQPALTNGTSRFGLESAIPGTFAGLIRMLLESAALF